MICPDLTADATWRNLSMPFVTDSRSTGKELQTVAQKGLDALKKCWPVGWFGGCSVCVDREASSLNKQKLSTSADILLETASAWPKLCHTKLPTAQIIALFLLFHNAICR